MRRKVLLIVGLVLLLQVLWVPAISAAPPAPGYGPGWGGGGFWYTVRWGDSLSGIGWRYGVSPWSICSANGLANCNYIYAGQSLWIPGGGGPGPIPGCAAYHRVTWGQTLSGVAAWYGVSTWRLAQANSIYNLNRIYAGQRLCIPGWW
jgi:LysM repeat protein